MTPPCRKAYGSGCALVARATAAAALLLSLLLLPCAAADATMPAFHAPPIAPLSFQPAPGVGRGSGAEGSAAAADALAPWRLDGHATFQGDFLRLTADAQSQSGRALARRPAGDFDGASHWRADWTFRISGSGYSLTADGMALWYTSQPLTVGNIFGAGDRYRGLGVFIDTYDNAPGSSGHGYPWITAALNDGTYQLVHDAKGYRTALHPSVGCAAQVRQQGVTNKLVTLRLIYSANERRLRVYYTTGNYPGDYVSKASFEWTHCFVLNDVEIPPGYFWGMSASTGDLTDNHDVFMLRVHANYPPGHGSPGRTESQGEQQQQQQQQREGGLETPPGAVGADAAARDSTPAAAAGDDAPAEPRAQQENAANDQNGLEGATASGGNSGIGTGDGAERDNQPVGAGDDAQQPNGDDGAQGTQRRLDTDTLQRQPPVAPAAPVQCEKPQMSVSGAPSDRLLLQSTTVSVNAPDPAFSL